MVLTDPETVKIVESIPFERTFEWDHFNFPDQPLCIVDNYRVTITDSKGETSVIDVASTDGGLTWATGSQNLAGFGDKFLIEINDQSGII